MIKELQEEILILALPDLIGSVGGSLGLFFGFCVAAPLLYIINRTIDKCCAIDVQNRPKVGQSLISNVMKKY